MVRRSFAPVYMWSIVLVGWIIIIASISQLSISQIDFRFTLLALMVVGSSQIAVRIPRVSGRITVADTFIFLTLLLYGGPAAVVMSALEGACTTLRIVSKKPRTILLNSAVLALSTFITATTVRFVFGSPTE